MRLHWHTLQCNFNEIEQVFNLLHSLFLNVIFYLTNVQGWIIKLKKINLKVRKEQRIGERLTKITEMRMVKMNYNERRIEKRERRKFFLLFFILIFLLNVWHLRVFFFFENPANFECFYFVFLCFFLKNTSITISSPSTDSNSNNSNNDSENNSTSCPFCKKEVSKFIFFSHIPKCYWESCIKTGFLPMCTCNSCNGERTHPNDTLSLINTQQPKFNDSMNLLKQQLPTTLPPIEFSTTNRRNSNREHTWWEEMHCLP